MNKIIIIFFFLFCFINANTLGNPTVGTFTPLNSFHPPMINTYYPVNNSIEIIRGVTCNINIYDVKGDTMNISWYENTSGSWVLQQNNNSVGNGTYYWDYVNSTSLGIVYYWRVCINDGTWWNNQTYSFTAETLVLKAEFTYVIDGSNIICTSTSTGSPSGYKWDTSVDGMVFGTTGWINDSTGITQTFSFPDGGIYFVKLFVTARNDTDWIMKSIGPMDSVKDIYPPENYKSCKNCEDAGYYWYDDSCHDEPETLPWNEKPEPPGVQPEGPSIAIFGWNIPPEFLLFFILGLILIIFFVKKKKKKKKKKLILNG